MNYQPGFLSFEQERRDALKAEADRLAAAKAEKVRLRVERKAEAEKLKSRRRWAREDKAREKKKHAHLWAGCGINLYSYDRLNSRCHHCKQPLVWTSFEEATSNKRPCQKPPLAAIGYPSTPASPMPINS